MLRDDINNALKEAMKAKNERAVSTLRMILPENRYPLFGIVRETFICLGAAPGGPLPLIL